MNKPTVQVASLTDIYLRNLLLPMIVVYENPVDFPGKYVARMWDCNDVTELAMVKDTLTEIHNGIPHGFICTEPSPHDDPVIIEVWL
jgi:hypothetical protein